MENEDLKQAKKKYDTVCKKVLSQKPVLAKILKSCVSEYKDYDEKFIEEHCIEGNTISLSTGVNPDESYPHITGDDTVDKLEQEGTVYYDIRFNTLIPGTDEYVPPFLFTLTAIKLLNWISILQKCCKMAFF